MRVAAARWIIEEMRPYLLARKYGWLTVCIAQFVFFPPALIMFVGISLVKLPAYLWSGVGEWWSDEVGEYKGIDPFCWAKPNFRDAEKDAILAQCFAALNKPTNTAEKE